MEDRVVLWSMFYSAIVAMQYHPGVKVRLSLQECAAVADDMLLEALCRG